MRTAPARGGRLLVPSPRILTPASPEFSCEWHAFPQIGLASAAWLSANDPLALPFRLSQPATVTQLGWVNGSAAGDNADIGIYTPAWARLVSAGSTACSGNSAWQWVDVADTTLPAGKYYLVYVRSSVTANRVIAFNNGSLAGMMVLAGAQESSTDALPLPDPLTNMGTVATNTRPFLCGIALGVPVA